ncbi:MAG: hypothetical protein HGA33_04825 [Candidatus Moranbacteria bacterium]|nr:hypothetical protein [Candidatus Moranbacteria bacterium]
MKRNLFITGSLLAVGALFAGVYVVVFKNNPSNPVADERKRVESKQEEAKLFSQNASGETVSTVIDSPTVGATILDENHIAYFADRQLKRTSLGGGGEEVILSDLPGEVLDAIWSPDRERVLALMETGSEKKWFLVVPSEKTTTSLKAGIISPVWSNLSERIFYSYADPKSGKAELDSAKPDGTDWKRVATMDEPSTFLSTVPATAIISYWNKPSAFEATSLYTVSASGGTPKKIFSEKFGADYLWSPDGTKVLISNTLSKGGTETRLGIANRDGGEFKTLQAPTITSKAVWSKDAKTVYYALPLSIPDHAVLPNDYFGRPIHTQDSFWKMDVATGKSDRIIEPDRIDGSYDSFRPFLGPDERYLYFTDRVSGKLHRIPLK